MSARSFVLVPGAGGSAWYWHLVEQHLRARGHDTVAVELPASDDDAGLQEYADTVVAAADGRRGVVVVGQSLGGFTAPLVCEPLDASLLALVNAMIPLPGESAGVWWETVGQREARVEADLAAGRDPDAPFDLQLYFGHDLPSSLKDELLTHGSEESDAVFRKPNPLERWPDVPVHVLSGRDDRLFPLAFQQRVARERLGVEPTVLPGGHLVALSNAEGVSGHLADWAAGDA